MNSIFKSTWQTASASMDAYLALMQATLIEWGNINSYAMNLPGLARQYRAIDAFCAQYLPNAKREPVNLAARQMLMDDGKPMSVALGQALRLQINPQAALQILLVGHMDTVFAPDASFQHVIHLDSKALQGPGILDMKGGLVVMLMALHVFQQSAVATSLGFTVLITPDEEIGSPGSRQMITDLAKQHDVGFIYEPGLDAEGTLVSTRPGKGTFSIVARGVSAHSGRDITAGRNAVATLAEVVCALTAMNDPKQGKIINVGVMHGGDAVNRVPDSAICRFEIRFTEPAVGEMALADIKNVLQATENKTGVQLSLAGELTKQPKIATPDFLILQQWCNTQVEAAGMRLGWQATGGVCDGNTTQAVGLPTVDTLGVCGSGAHTESEMILIDSLVERLKLSLLLWTALAVSPPQFNRIRRIT